ncbi:M23 family metallopeptidase [Plantibacter sp. YIM 135249]|uniref:M23 family metallopeptidase n=1 Tax=Plantibacter sp. YIM 135249 TaxID=3423918 RepID=UPI003D344975
MVLKYQFPFPIEWYDTDDKFGNTSPPWRTPSSPHRGSDFNGGSSGQSKTPIPAIAAGRVVFSGWYPGLGYMVTLSHADGAFSGYCHQWTASPLTVGENVPRGGIVGGIGGTADGTFEYAPHLHLTMGWDIAGTQGGASRFDPIPFIQARLNGDDPGTTNPLQEEDDMYILVRGQGTPMVYLSNMIIRRPIATEPELAGVQWWLGQRGISDTSVKVVDDVAAFGVVVKP